MLANLEFVQFVGKEFILKAGADGDVLFGPSSSLPLVAEWESVRVDTGAVIEGKCGGIPIIGLNVLGGSRSGSCAP